jgi:hypothetical protein
MAKQRRVVTDTQQSRLALLPAVSNKPGTPMKVGVLAPGSIETSPAKQKKPIKKAKKEKTVHKVAKILKQPKKKPDQPQQSDRIQSSIRRFYQPEDDRMSSQQEDEPQQDEPQQEEV